MGEDEKKRWANGPRWLPLVCLDGIAYYVDERCHEFRDVTTAWPIRFDTPKGQEMLESFYIDECSECGLELGIANDCTDNALTCRRCGHRVPICKER